MARKKLLGILIAAALATVAGCNEGNSHKQPSSINRVPKSTASLNKADPQKSYVAFSQLIKAGKTLTIGQFVEWEGKFVGLVPRKELYRYHGTVSVGGILSKPRVVKVADKRTPGVLLEFAPLHGPKGQKGEVWLEFDKGDSGESWKDITKGAKVRIRAEFMYIMSIISLKFDDGTPMPEPPKFVVVIGKVKLLTPGK